MMSIHGAGLHYWGITQESAVRLDLLSCCICADSGACLQAMMQGRTLCWIADVGLGERALQDLLDQLLEQCLQDDAFLESELKVLFSAS